MDEAERRRAEAAADPERWRVGESRGTGRRNLYRGETQVARADTPEVAEFLVGLANAEVDRLEQVERDRAVTAKRCLHAGPWRYDATINQSRCDACGVRVGPYGIRIDTGDVR